MKTIVGNESCHEEERVANQSESHLLSRTAKVEKNKMLWEQRNAFSLAYQREKLLSQMLKDMSIIRNYLHELWAIYKTLKKDYKKRKGSKNAYTR